MPAQAWILVGRRADTSRSKHGSKPKSAGNMSKKHIVFVVNPRSGVERQKEIKQGIDDCLDSDKYTHEIVQTEFVNGTKLANEAARQGAWAVVAVGGRLGERCGAGADGH